MNHGLVRVTAVDLGILFATKAAIGAYVLAKGFTHVSDDDYARVVIAEQFAFHPRLDPSGTSWLPFPFWINGGAMILGGRSLGVATTMAFTLGVVSLAAPYLAMRATGSSRTSAVVATALAASVPWSVWLGVATVPEAMTAALVAAGVIGVASNELRLPAAAMLLAAALSRYEAWPACAVFAIACIAGMGRSTRQARDLGAACIACSGPLLWMAWNEIAHGSPTHFLARVAAYRQAVGAAAASPMDKVTAFPRALWETSPVVVVGAGAALVAVVVDEETRARWSWALAGALATLAFLVIGDARDGAPTHHPARALLPVVWILALFASSTVVLAFERLAHKKRPAWQWVLSFAAAGTFAWGLAHPDRWDEYPGASPEESRTAQIARGRALAGSSGPIEVTPCAYEHFALIAALGEPERVRTLAAPVGSPPLPVTSTCPQVAFR